MCLFCATMFISLPKDLSAQELSSEQKEVKITLEKIYDFWVKRDLEGYMSCLHEKYTGWYGNDPLPLDKSSPRKWEMVNDRRARRCD